MKSAWQNRPFMYLSSIGKKYIMAITGLVLAGFVWVHMLGNLQIFAGADAINRYAHFLKSLPLPILWGFRLCLFFSVVLHALMAFLLTKENKRAKPKQSPFAKTLQAGIGSKTMGITGSILLFFIVFHLFHFTITLVHPEYHTVSFMTELEGKTVLNVHKMVIHGFSYTGVSIFYIVAMACLALHLSHGVTSAFQSLGLRNNKLKPFFDFLAKLYALLVFLGFIAVPMSVLISKYTSINLLPIY